MNIIFTIIISIIPIELLFLLILIFKKRKPNSTGIIRLDSYTTDFYIKLLDQIIQYQSVYYIDSAFGKKFSSMKSVSPEIDNDDITNAYQEIIIEIDKTISSNMRDYLNYAYGEKWLNDYIRVETLSIVMNYSKQTIESLTIDKFNSK